MEGIMIEKIGETIRTIRIENGMSQGHVEKATGLKRCYLSRTENGHTTPGLDVLQKLATAFGIHISEFFPETIIRKAMPADLNLTDADILFLTQVQRCAKPLTDIDRKLLLAMVRKFSAFAPNNSALVKP
jgi:transcriptional regulator with XRE-family HTH domain